MRMRDVIQLLKNIGSNSTVKFSGTSVLPSFELSGKGILDLHANSIWVAILVGDAFLKSRIMWENLEHEFRFMDPAIRGTVCRDALMQTATELNKAKGQTTSRSATEFAIINLIVACESILVVAAKNTIASRADYNKWVSDIGGDAGEKMTEGEHLAALLNTIRTVRLYTYPMWYSLIDILPDGATKAQAEQKLRAGCETVGLDTAEITPDWQVSTLQNS